MGLDRSQRQPVHAGCRLHGFGDRMIGLRRRLVRRPLRRGGAVEIARTKRRPLDRLSHHLLWIVDGRRIHSGTRDGCALSGPCSPGIPSAPAKDRKMSRPASCSSNSPPVDLQLTGVIARGVEGSKSKLLAWGPSVRRLARGGARESVTVHRPLPAARNCRRWLLWRRPGTAGGQAARGCGSKMSNGLPSAFAAGVGGFADRAIRIEAKPGHLFLRLPDVEARSTQIGTNVEHGRSLK